MKTPRDPHKDAHEARLKSFVSEGTQSLVLVVGAGVSTAAGAPTWDQLMRELTREAAAARAGIEPESVRHAIHSYQLRSPSPSETHRALAALRPRAVITTNFDNLVEEALLAAGRPVKIYSRAELVPFTTDTVPVLKLHGSIDSTDSLIVAARERLLGSARPPLDHWFLGTLLSTSVVLFVGFSLDDTDIEMLYEQYGHVGYGPGKWFLLSSEKETVTEELWRRRGVAVVHVPAAKVPNFLQVLANEPGTPALALQPSSDRIYVAGSARHDSATLVNQLLGRLGFETFNWFESKVRTLGPPFRIEDSLRASQAAIIVLDDSAESGAVNPNLLYELGLAIGVLGRERVLVVAPRGSTVPTDLNALRYLFIETADEGYLRPALQRWATDAGLRPLGQRSPT